MTQPRPAQPTSPTELIDLVQSLSEAAIRSTWKTGTSNAAWLLTRYGGTWGRADATTHADLLDTIESTSSALALWPITGPARMTADGLPTSEIVMTSRRTFRDRWALLEGDGVVVVDGELHLRATGPRSALRLRCGADIGTSARPAPARPRPLPWCSKCGGLMAADVESTLDWSPTIERH